MQQMSVLKSRCWRHGERRLGADVTPADVMVTRDQNNLHLNLNGGADRLTITNWFGGQAHRIERVSFEDGTAWTAQDLVSRIVVQPGTTGADSIRGDETDNVIDGLAGNDQIFGKSQNDSRVVEVGWVLNSRRWQDGERGDRRRVGTGGTVGNCWWRIAA